MCKRFCAISTDRKHKRGNADIAAEMPLRHWCRFINDHIALVQQSLHNINRVLGRIEMLLELHRFPVRVGDGNIIPGVDIDFFYVVLSEKRRDDRKLRHFPVQFFGHILLRQIGYGVAVVVQVF